MKDSIRFKLESGEKESPLLTVFIHRKYASILENASRASAMRASRGKKFFLLGFFSRIFCYGERSINSFKQNMSGGISGGFAYR